MGNLRGLIEIDFPRRNIKTSLLWTCTNEILPSSRRGHFLSTSSEHQILSTDKNCRVRRILFRLHTIGSAALGSKKNVSSGTHSYWGVRQQYAALTPRERRWTGRRYALQQKVVLEHTCSRVGAFRKQAEAVNSTLCKRVYCPFLRSVIAIFGGAVALCPCDVIVYATRWLCLGATPF